MINTDPGALLDVAGAVLIIGLGAWLLRYRPRTRAHVGFFLFAVGFGARNVIATLVVSAPPGSVAVLLPSLLVATLFSVVAVAGLLLLALNFPVPVPRRDRRLVAVAAVVGFGPSILLVSLLLQAPSFLPALGIPRSLAPYAVVEGLAVGLMIGAMWFAVALFALRHHRLSDAEGPADRLRGQYVLMAAALALWPAVQGGQVMSGSVATPALVGTAVVLVVTVAALWLRTVPTTGSRGPRYVAWLVLGVTLAAYVQSLVGGGWGAVTNSGAAGIARTVAVVLVAYSIVRYQSFDIDLKVKWTVKQSTVAAAFIAVFFVVSEGAQQFFQGTSLGPWLGIAAAGALVFALAPIQRMAERIADAAMPGVEDSEAYLQDRRLTIYRSTLETLMADGRVTAKERRTLLNLQEELGITGDEANRMEGEVLDGLGGGGPAGGGA